MSSIFTIQYADIITSEPPSYTQATLTVQSDLKPLPPAYNSATKPSFSSTLHTFLRFQLAIVHQTFAHSLVTLFVLLLILADLFMFTVGAISQHKCPYDPHLPIWLIVNSFAWMLLIFQCLAYVWIRCKSILAGLGVFIVVWLVRGTWLIWRGGRRVDLIETSSGEYCAESVFVTIKVFCAGAWLLMAYFVVYFLYRTAVTLRRSHTRSCLRL